VGIVLLDLWFCHFQHYFSNIVGYVLLVDEAEEPGETTTSLSLVTETL
jgi:hypothetical protein